MASKKKKAAAAAGGAVGAARAAKDNPYVQRLVEDDDLRDTIQEAYEAARSAYDRLQSGKGSPAKKLLDDKKLQAELKSAAESIRDASNALRESPSKRGRKKGGGLFRKVAILAVAGGLALALSEDLRKKVLDLLFGAEEEFEYTSTTTTTPPASSENLSAPTTADGPAPDAAEGTPTS